MTMLSFRVDPEEAIRAKELSEELGISLSEMFRDAFRRHLNAFLAERDAETYEAMPLTKEELALCDVQYWGPAEDWSDWVVDDDAAG